MIFSALRLSGAAALLALASAPGYAQDTVKIGIVGQMTGPFAVIGEGYRQGVEAFQAKYGATVGNRKVEVLIRDSAGSDSTAAKRLTEELVVKDRVSLLGGFSLTPDAASAAPVVNEAKTPAFLFNAATPMLTNMSPYYLRTGQNIAQPAELGAVYASSSARLAATRRLPTSHPATSSSRRSSPNSRLKAAPLLARTGSRSIPSTSPLSRSAWLPPTPMCLSFSFRRVHRRLATLRR